MVINGHFLLFSYYHRGSFFGCHFENSLLLSQDTLCKGFLLSLLAISSLLVPPKSISAIPSLYQSYLLQSQSQFSCSVMSDYLQPHEPQHARPPCPSPTPRVHPNHWVGDAIQPSHPLSSPSPALNLSQHQGLFQWVNSLHQVARGLEFQLQHQSFQWTPRTDLL